MNTKEIFTLGLGLEHPWEIQDVWFEADEDRRILVIDVGFRRGHKFVDSDSGAACSVHDTIGRSWRHLAWLWALHLGGWGAFSPVTATGNRPTCPGPSRLPIRCRWLQRVWRFIQPRSTPHLYSW